MRGIKLRLALLLFVVFNPVFSTAVLADNFIWNTTGTFENPQGSALSLSSVAGTNSNQISWGVLSRPSFRSNRIDFISNSFSTPVNTFEWDSQILGAIFYFNGAAQTGSSLDSLSLSLHTKALAFNENDGAFSPVDVTETDSDYYVTLGIEVLSTVNTGDYLGDRDGLYFSSINKSIWVPENEWGQFYLIGSKHSPMGLIDIVAAPGQTGAGVYVGTTMPIPEPEIYAMMGLGLGLLGWVRRKTILQMQ